MKYFNRLKANPLRLLLYLKWILFVISMFAEFGVDRSTFPLFINFPSIFPELIPQFFPLSILLAIALSIQIAGIVALVAKLAATKSISSRSRPQKLLKSLASPLSYQSP